MDGLIVKKRGSCIEEASKRAERLLLLAKGDGMEVMLQEVKQGELIALSPGENDLMEFFYILEGEMESESIDSGTKLVAGDSLQAQGLKETVYFKTITPVSMLYMASQPVFHLLSDEIAELVKISNMVIEKDRYTYDHNARIRSLSLRIAERMRFSKDRLEGLLYAALYHDLGKISVPEEILNKPGQLNDEEYEIIKKHAEEGRQILDRTYLKKVGVIIEQHHERLDGSGYPKGLKADEILLEAKIIAVVDSFDAMTSERVYHKPITYGDAIAELRTKDASKYDQSIVDILEQILVEEGSL